MRLLLLACTGGALGAGARYLVYVGAGRLIGAASPYAAATATMTVNIIGSFIMGAAIEAIALRFEGSPELRVFLMTGVLGGFTTFSAFSLDFVHMMQRGEAGHAAAYAAVSVSVSILALYAGMAATRMVLP
jgi:fluoride exporter